MQYQLRTYNITPGGKPAGPTPVRPSGFRPPMVRVRDAPRQTIDQIHDAVNDENLDDHLHIGDGSSGAESPEPGDDLDCDEEE